MSKECKTQRDVTNTAAVVEVINPRGNRYAIKGKCPICGTGVHKFVPKSDYELWLKEGAS